MEEIVDGTVLPVTEDTHKYINPKVFDAGDLPIIVLCDDLRSFTGWAIKNHTRGDYNHAFTMHKPGMLVSQNFKGFEESKIDVYMKPGMMLKFWRIKNLTPDEKFLILSALNNRLALPLWKRGYDFFGVLVGQFLHVKWLQNPFQMFCSEQVWKDYIMSVSRLGKLGDKEPSPTDMNTIFVNNPKYFECLGYYWD